MRDKIHTALRIAIHYKYERLCIGTFGLGPGFRNPVEEVAIMWRDALLKDPEFIGRFRDIVFAFEAPEGLEPVDSSSSKASSSKTQGSSSKGPSSSSSQSTTGADLEIFKYVFKPAVVHDAFKTPTAHGYTPAEPGF
jgi:hypothetical protein